MNTPENWKVVEIWPGSTTYGTSRLSVFPDEGHAIITVELDDVEYEPGRYKCRVVVRTMKGDRLPHPQEVADIEHDFKFSGWSILTVATKSLELGAIVDPRAGERTPT